MTRSRALTFVALSIALALAACSDESGGGGAGGGSGGSGGGGPDVHDLEPGVLTGTAYGTDGEPLSNARVQIDPALTSGTPLVVHTDAQGVYRVEGLPLVPYYVDAWHEVTFDDRNFCLRLGMPSEADYEPVTPTNGAVRDFEWQLTGPIPDFVADPEYFGGRVYLDLTGDFGGAEVELTFTPTTSLLDGSAAQTITRTFDPAVDDHVVEDLPVANYTVTGVVRVNGSETALHLGLAPADTYAEQSESAELAFEPGGNPCVSLASGVAPAYLFLNSHVDWQY